MAYFNDELIHVVPLLAPIDITTSTTVSDVVNMARAHSIQFCVQFGVITDDTAVITVLECDDVSPSNSTAIAFSYRESSAVGTDSMGDRTAATSTGVTVAADDDGKAFYIDVDASELSDGYPYIQVSVDPGSSMSVCLMSISCMIDARYPQETQISAVV